jgi:uncharacterized protein YlxW (UPF0749 family)
MPPTSVTDAPNERGARLDASMSLISDLFRNPIDEGYAEAAKKHLGNDAPTEQHRWLTLVALAVVGLLLAAAGVQVRNNAGQVSNERSELQNRIEATTARNDELERTAQDLEAQIDQLQAEQLNLADAGEAQATALTQLRTHVGTTRVTGPGIVITVNDARRDSDATPDDGYDESRVTDLDLQHIVDGLWQAGAEAVSVNGQRLTALSAIRSARDVVSINYRPISPPYEISAIGDPETLATNFAEGSGGAWLQAISSLHGIRYELRNHDELMLPAASVRLRHAERTTN